MEDVEEKEEMEKDVDREARSQLQARGQYLIKTEPESEDQLDWGQNHHNSYINYILFTLIVNTNDSSMIKCYLF